MLSEFEAAELYKCMTESFVSAHNKADEVEPEEYERRMRKAVHSGYLLWRMGRNLLRRERSKADGRESLAGVAGETPPRRTEGDSELSGPSSLAEWREECNRHG